MITLTLNNYENQKVTYTMPDTAEIKIISENILTHKSEIVKTGLKIDITCFSSIKTKREDIE